LARLAVRGTFSPTGPRRLASARRLPRTLGVTNTLPVESVLRAYVEVWSEPDATRREALLRICWSEDSEILGPGYYFMGPRAVLDEVARFQRDDPGFRPVLTSGFDSHDQGVRFSIAVLDPEGTVVSQGWDVVEFAPGGRIARVITFWGELPQIPQDWPAKLVAVANVATPPQDKE